jgi:hypothetical protein
MASIAIVKYQDAMRDAICSVCVCFAEDKQTPGRCVHEQSGQCRLFAHLDDVADVVSGVASHSIDPYVEALRRQVCAKCGQQDERGVCDLRDRRGPVPNWCVLDAYFNLIVGTVEEVQRMERYNLA